jgi:two-component system CheB/CheR fusion protein
VVPEQEQFWFDICGGVALSGVPARFESEAQALGRFFEVSAFPIGDPEQRQVAVLFKDISKRKRAEAEHAQALTALRVANERLLEADRYKNDFLAVLSHELRNPLTPIRNGVWVLDHVPPGSEQAKRAREVIDRQAKHMSRLVDDLLDVTRISRGKIVLKRERVDLNAIARGTAEDHREMFARVAVRLEIADAGRPLWVDGDRSRLMQVIGNLLTNSAKFTQRGGRTVLSVSEREGRAVVGVCDDGSGMSQEMQERLFEPFVQAAQTLERARGGLGLGLALVKALMDLHGGTAVARSEGEGLGSEFEITLPMERSGWASSSVPEIGKQSSGNIQRVLIVEDNVDSAASLRDLLALVGHEVTVAHSGPEGLRAAHASKPDVILCDIGLPGLDGYEVARSIRADAKLKDTYLVALSGYALPEDVTKSKDAGFDRHIAKPPSTETLWKMLDERASLRSDPVRRRGTG